MFVKPTGPVGFPCAEGPLKLGAMLEAPTGLALRGDVEAAGSSAQVETRIAEPIASSIVVRISSPCGGIRNGRLSGAPADAQATRYATQSRPNHRRVRGTQLVGTRGSTVPSCRHARSRDRRLVAT